MALVGQYAFVANQKQDVNVRRANKVAFDAKLRKASRIPFLPNPRLVKKTA